MTTRAAGPPRNATATTGAASEPEIQFGRTVPGWSGERRRTQSAAPATTAARLVARRPTIGERVAAAPRAAERGGPASASASSVGGAPTARARRARSRPRARTRAAIPSESQTPPHRARSSPRSRPRSPRTPPADRRGGRRSRPRSAQLRLERRAPAARRRGRRASRTARRRRRDGTGRLTVKPRPVPDPTSLAGPVPGYSGDWWIETNSTSSVAWKMSLVPLPWWTSQSRIITRSSPRRIDRVARRDGDVVEQAEAHRAGRQRVVAGRAVRAEARTAPSPSSSRSTIATAPPAACSAASNEPALTTVSASS